MKSDDFVKASLQEQSVSADISIMEQYQQYSPTYPMLLHSPSCTTLAIEDFIGIVDVLFQSS
jgi:hypothetical protein